jgi:hypothetical protein
MPVNTYTHQWRLLRGGQLIIMAGTERLERHQTNGNQVLDVLDTIPLIPLVITTSPSSPNKVPPTLNLISFSLLLLLRRAGWRPTST